MAWNTYWAIFFSESRPLLGHLVFLSPMKCQTFAKNWQKLTKYLDPHPFFTQFFFTKMTQNGLKWILNTTLKNVTFCRRDTPPPPPNVEKIHGFFFFFNEGFPKGTIFSLCKFMTSWSDHRCGLPSKTKGRHRLCRSGEMWPGHYNSPGQGINANWFIQIREENIFTRRVFM